MTAIFWLAFGYMRSNNIVARTIVLAILMLMLEIPLNMIGGVIADRQNYEKAAEQGVTESWGRAQTFIGPMIRLAYHLPSESGRPTHFLTLLPEKLTIDGNVTPERRRRSLFTVVVYTTTLDVVAEFDIRVLKALAADGHPLDWSSAKLELGLTDPKSVDIKQSEVEGHALQWSSTNDYSSLFTLQALLAVPDFENRDTVTVRLHIAFDGSHILSIVPIGRRSDVKVASSWTSPSFMGPYLPHSQTIDTSGFHAGWTVLALGHRYGQLWDSAVRDSVPAPITVLESGINVSLIDPVDAYRETDRAIKYAVMIIGLTFTLCLVFELATGIRPSVAQYGLIGLSLCIFYLLLLSFSERIGFAPAYTVSGAAVVVQATVYSWFLHRRLTVALGFGIALSVLYAGLYTLLQLEEAALLSGSLVLFAVLSLAMWLTRNLHRAQPT